jgi:hypothetical protein
MKNKKAILDLTIANIHWMDAASRMGVKIRKGFCICMKSTSSKEKPSGIRDIVLSSANISRISGHPFNECYDVFRKFQYEAADGIFMIKDIEAAGRSLTACKRALASSSIRGVDLFLANAYKITFKASGELILDMPIGPMFDKGPGHYGQSFPSSLYYNLYESKDLALAACKAVVIYLLDKLGSESESRIFIAEDSMRDSIVERGLPPYLLKYEH